jgi:hypothetical protein
MQVTTMKQAASFTVFLFILFIGPEDEGNIFF